MTRTYVMHLVRKGADRAVCGADILHKSFATHRLDQTGCRTCRRVEDRRLLARSIRKTFPAADPRHLGPLS